MILLTDPAMRAAFSAMLTGVIAAPGTPPEVHEAALRALPLLGADQAGSSFKILAAQLREGRHLATAARAVTQLPRAAWSKDEAGPAAESILAWAKGVPADQRTAQTFVETVQVGNEMAGLLAPAESSRIRKELLALGVRVFVIKTVREQMRYDITRLVVEAGKPFQIIFENLDMMPHNLVLVQPGAREEVGLQAQSMSPFPDSQGRVYVPNSKKVIASSKLLEAGQKQTLQFTAPDRPGNYEYVCTYPEHYKTMFGELVVVENLAAFLEADAPVSPPAPSAQTPAAPHAHH